MLIKAAIFLTAFAAAATPLLAASPEVQSQQTVVKPASPAVQAPQAVSVDAPLALKPAPGAPTDITGGRGPNPHAGELNAIAIYKSVGNRVDAEIAASRIAAFGVNRRAIRQSLDWVQVHGHSTNRGQTAAPANERHAEMGWGAAQ